MPVFSNLTDHPCRHDGVSHRRMRPPAPVQSGLAGGTGQRYRAVTVAGTVIPCRKLHGAVNGQGVQPAGRVIMRCRCLLQDPRIKISIENNQRTPAGVVLQLRRNIRSGGGVSQFIVTDTVYGSSGRIDADRRFQAGFKYCFTPGIHQTDFQRLRGVIQPGRFGIEKDRVLR